MALPAATLDHVVINARDDMDRGADLYRRLGFTLTERGYHSLGSINHLAMFGTDYLELIAVPKGATSGRLDLLDYPFGLNGLVFGSEDSTVTYNELSKVGVPVEPPAEFTRPVKVGGIYNATLPVLTDGQRGDVQQDPNGFVLTRNSELHGVADVTPTMDTSAYTAGAVWFDTITWP